MARRYALLFDRFGQNALVNFGQSGKTKRERGTCEASHTAAHQELFNSFKTIDDLQNATKLSYGWSTLFRSLATVSR